MPQPNEKVLAMVRREVERDPGVSNAVLAAKAAAIDRSVRKLSKLQFHGTYRLTVARELAAAGRGRAPASAAKKARRGRAATKRSSKGPPAMSSAANFDGERSAVRAALLEFAGVVAQADSKSDVVRVLSTIDRYVDRVVAAAAGS